MSTTSFLIRDGLASDVEACQNIDHRYQTDFVWQMTLNEQVGSWNVTFRKDRLPRTIETEYLHNPEHLKLVLGDEHCFLVAVSRDSNEVLGYLTMWHDRMHDLGQIQNIVVDFPLQRHRIGSRLYAVARKWAEEHKLSRLMAEVRTQNYPGIAFCQQMGMHFCGFNDHYLRDQDIAVFFTQSVR
jgi:ribosomal protein S18 acetylase RimI-like enzyme